MKKLIVVSGLLIIIISGIAASCEAIPSTGGVVTAQVTAATQARPTVFHSPGDAVKVYTSRDAWEVQLVDFKIVDPATIPKYKEIYPDLKQGDRFLILSEHVKNLGTTIDSFAGMQLSLQTPNGDQNFPSQVDLLDYSGTGVGGPVSPGMELRGNEVRVIPANVHVLYWVYTPSDNLSQTFWKISL